MSPTVTSQPASALDLKRAAALLIATLPAFVAYVAFAVMTIAEEVKTSADLTPAQLDELGAAWLGLHVLWVLPPVLAALALTLVSRRLDGPARYVPILTAVTIVCAVAYVLVNITAYTSDAETWGDTSLYPWSVFLSVAAGWFGTLPATILVSSTVARRGIARRTSWTVTGLVGAYWCIEVLTYLPVIIGDSTFAEFEGGLPPFLLGVFWAVLGGGLLRSRVPSQG